MERAIPGDPSWAELAAPHLARYLAAAEHARDRRVLDAGSGSGYGAQLLTTAGATLVQAVDVDACAVRQAEEQFGRQGIEFLVDNCEELSAVSGPFDLVCCFEVIEHLSRPERFLQRASSLLAADGILLVSTPDRAAGPPFVNGRPRNPFHLHEWYRGEFQELLASCFSQVELRIQVESAALRSRVEAVAALRQGLMWSSPALTFFWRKMPLVPKRKRPWKKLAGLAAPTIADYPIVPLALAPIFGTPRYHFAICRQPKRGASS